MGRAIVKKGPARRRRKAPAKPGGKRARRAVPKRVSVSEAKDRLPELLRAVEKGARVEITRRGAAVAALVPWNGGEAAKEAPAEEEGFFMRLYRERPADFEGVTDEEVNSWRDRSPPPPPIDFS